MKFISVTKARRLRAAGLLKGNISPPSTRNYPMTGRERTRRATADQIGPHPIPRRGLAIALVGPGCPKPDITPRTC